MDIETVTALIDEIGCDSCDLGEVNLAFRLDTRTPGGRAADAVSAALCSPFPSPDYDFCPAPPDLLVAWGGLAAVVRAPAVSGRLHDLLWTHRHGDKPHEHARRAIEGYLTGAASRSGEFHWRTRLLERALAIAREINADQFLERIRTQAQRGLESGTLRGDGAAREDDIISRIQLLVDIPGAEDDDQLRATFGELRRLFADSWIHDREDLVLLEQKLVAKRRDGVERDRLQRELVDIWRDYAELREAQTPPPKIGPSVREAFSRALSYATELPDSGTLTTEIRRQMARASDRNVGRFNIAFDIPAGFAEAITGDDGLQRCSDAALRTVWPARRSVGLQTRRCGRVAPKSIVSDHGPDAVACQ